MKHTVSLMSFLAILFLGGTALGQLTAHFGATPTSGCSPIVVQFSDSSTGGAVSWLWDLGNGTISTAQNPSKTYTVGGTYSVTLKVTDASGNSNTKTVSNFITVVPKPQVSFVVSDSLPGCIPKTVTFTSSVVAGVPGALTYTWDFGDGTLSNLVNPTYTYTTTGNFDVTLSVTNGQGCNKSVTKTAYIKTSQKPVADFSFSGNSSCSLPITVSFSNSTTGASSSTYQWSFGNGLTSGATNPTTVYTTAGTYQVRLISTIAGSACADTITKSVTVTATPPVAGFSGPATGCTGKAIFFQNTTTPTPGSTLWNFGDGTSSTAFSPSKTYNAPGTYIILFKVFSGTCRDSIIRTITIDPSPTATFTINPTPPTGCSIPQTFTFTNTSANANTYNWSFGDGTTSTSAAPTKTYTTFGSYNVVLTSSSSNGCTTASAPTTVTLVRPTLSVAAAYPAGTCAPASVNFTHNFSAADAGTTYIWNFGDGTNGTGAAPSHTYTAAGTYTVTVTATSGIGCTATATTTVNMGTKPTAAFTAAPLSTCVNVPVGFTSTSSGGSVYLWRFGDGGSSSAVNPTHLYTAPGSYTVTLIVSNNGCADTLTQTNYITIAGPVAQFTDNFLCSNKALHNFTNTSTGALSYEWDFGDGSTSNVASPSHTYATNGSFLVKLKAISGVCSSIITKRVYIYDISSQFAGTPLPVCKGESVIFALQNTANIRTVFWNFGDGTTSLPAAPASISKRYTTAGIYTVSVYATDSAGCVDTTIKTAYVQVRGPVVNFSALPTGACPGTPVQFTDASSIGGGGTIVSRIWTFGDGSTLGGNNNTPLKTYSAAGIYGVKLRITDDNGCTDSLFRPSYINLTKPVAAFNSTITVSCTAQSVVFSNTSSGGTTYLWSFGDGTTSTTTSPVKSYATPGSYAAQLIVTAPSGCKDTVTKTIVVAPFVSIASFSVSDSVASCPPFVVQFGVNARPGNTYLWRFGNGVTSTAANPSTLYSTAGVFTAKLIVTNTAGCKDSTTRTIRVNGPTGTLSYSPLSGCAPLPITFTVTATSTISYTYDFDNGITQTSASGTQTYAYPSGGLFNPVVILSNGAGCNVAIQAPDTLKISSLKAGFMASTNSLCFGSTVQFTDTSVSKLGGVISRLWSFGDGTTATTANPAKVYALPGVYTVKLRLTNGICTDSTSKTITVLARPVQILSANDTLCIGESSVLNVSGATGYVWSPGATLSCTTCPNPTASPTTTTTYTVIGTVANGCSDTDQVTVIVAPDPVVSAGPDKIICIGTATTLAATGAASYVWSPAAGLSCTVCPNPTASPTATTSYIVTGTSAAGCIGRDTVVVTVNPSIVLTNNGPKTICAGAATALTVSGATSYVWSPTTGLSCTNCPNPTASPAVTTTYTIVGNNPGGCAGTTTVLVTVNPLPVVSVTPNPAAFCAGSSVALTATGAASYVWSPAAGLSCTACPNPTASPASTTTYTVTGTDANGCINTATLPVTVNPLPVVTATASDANPCTGTAVTLTAGGASTYVWSPATGLSCTACPNPAATPTVPTTYTVTGRTAAGCTGTAQVTITPKPVPVLVTGPAAFCAGGSAPLSVSGAVSYVWSPATGLSCTTCPNPTASPASTTTYTVVGTGADGCTATTTVLVTVNPLPVLSAGPDRDVCAGVPVTLTATGAASYVWSPAAGLSCTACASPVATLAATTAYTITGTSAAGCVSTASVLLKVMPRSPVSVAGPQALCEGGSVQLNATGGSSYSWSPAGSLSDPGIANPLASPGVTTSYTVIIRQGDCYSDTLVTKVVVSPLPTVNAGPDKVVIAGSSTQLLATATDATIFSWSPAASLSCADCSAPSASPLETTVYRVEVKSSAGCTATDEITLSVQCDNNQLFVPNTFTPNGDGANDVFYPRGKGVRQVLSFRIYNRWGELLFVAENFQLNEESKGWNGIFKGVAVKPDVYVWVIDAICDTGAPLQRKGDVAIVK